MFVSLSSGGYHKNLSEMKELIVLLAKAIPEEKILSDMKEALINYQVSGSDDDKKSLEIQCMLFSTKSSLGDKDPMEMIDELNTLEKGKELLSPKMS